MRQSPLFTFITSALVVAAGLTSAAAQDTNPLDAYPAHLPKLQRHVIQLPATDNEADHQVELIIGKEERVDCNKTSLLGSLTEHSVQGWGYSYYQVAIQPGRMSTKMACLHQAKEKKFVSLPLATAQRFVRYNSKLPIVVYAPKDIDVNYRIWQAGTTTARAEQK